LSFNLLKPLPPKLFFEISFYPDLMKPTQSNPNSVLLCHSIAQVILALAFAFDDPIPCA